MTIPMRVSERREREDSIVVILRPEDDAPWRSTLALDSRTDPSVVTMKRGDLVNVRLDVVLEVSELEQLLEGHALQHARRH